MIMADAHAGIGPELTQEACGERNLRRRRRSLHAGLREEPSHPGEYQRKINVDLAEWHDRQII